MKNKKSQSEIMGLLMIVVLISIGLLIFVAFGLKSMDKKDINVEFTHKQLPVILNDAILETHTSESDCYGEKIQALMVKAGEGNNFVCKNGMSVRPFLEQEVGFLLNETLNKWGYNYRYFVYRGNDPSNNIFVINNSDCAGMNIDTEIFFFRLESGSFLNIKLDICS